MPVINKVAAKIIFFFIIDFPFVIFAVKKTIDYYCIVLYDRFERYRTIFGGSSIKRETYLYINIKKTITLLITLIGCTSAFAQNTKKNGDDMAAAANYSGAAMMYRLCMEQDDECFLKLIRLLYEEKVETQSQTELFRLSTQNSH